MRTHSVFQNRSDDVVLAATSPLACWLKVFKASRHSSWYPVLTFTDSIQIVIQNDSHDDVATNDGGLISSSSSYVFQAYRRLVPGNNIMAKIIQLWVYPRQRRSSRRGSLPRFASDWFENDC
jgi:hypothetical protein